MNRQLLALISLLMGLQVAILVAPVCAVAGDEAPTPEAIEFFEKKIRPVLVSRCYECHSSASKKLKGGLLLDSREGLLRGGDSGTALVIGDVDKSLLIKAVRQTDPDLQMPPKPQENLSAAQIADLEAWVKMGAPDPRKPPAKGTLVTTPPIKYGMSLEEGRQFWSFKPVQKSATPAVKNGAWVRSDVDPFILTRLEAAGVATAADADRRTLLRRVSFDLTGLPPTPAEVDAFLNDSSSDAFAKVVDRLLDSPRYGERWGRHWLDVVRYADTSGNASDYPIPQIYKYRDWVIRAIQRDMPYDRFLREQFAGDLLASSSETERNDHIVATGYLAIARRFGGGKQGEHHLTLEDTIDNLGRAVLGSTISCARCHDHKFDPFTMSDYYGLYGIFQSTRYPHPGAEGANRQEDLVPLIPQAEVDALLKAHREKIDLFTAEVKSLEAALAEASKAEESPEKKANVEAAKKAVADGTKRLADHQAQLPVFDNAYSVAEGKPENAKLQLRGDPKRLGDEVPRHFPAILGGQVLPADNRTSGRLQLAEWVSDPQNPLTARVLVNRIWQHHFGKGIVQTPNDFGRQGKPPTHPELLDFLATRFIESGWSIKAMHRLILLSHTWQLASSNVAESTRLDPHNELFWHFTRQRLDAESIRDTLLFVSGDLDETSPGGHPFPAQNTWGFTQHNPFFAAYESRHRSVYLMQQRLRKNPYLALFDGADPNSSTAIRQPSTTPLQALFVMNGLLAHTAATKFAERLTTSSPEEAARVTLAYQLALNRAPTTDEQQDCTDFLQSYRSRLTALKTPADQIESKTWSAFARALLSGNELIFVD